MIPPRTTARTSRPRVVAAALAATAASLAVLPAVANAAPIPTGDPSIWSVGPESPTVIAGVPARIALAGDASKTAATSPAGDTAPAAAISVVSAGVTCPKSYAETIGDVYARDYSWAAGDPAASPFATSEAVTFDQPGEYTACGYYGLTGTLFLPDDQDATRLLYAPRTFQVQRPTVGVALRLDGPLYPGATIRLLGSATSNAPETIHVQLNDATQGCQGAAPSNAALDQFATGPDPAPVYGSRQLATTVALPSRVGDYHLCMYASRDGQEGDPDLATDSAGQAGGILQVREAPVLPSASPVIYGSGRDGTKQVNCTLSPFAPRKGQRVTVSCRGIGGKIAIGLKKSRTGPVRASHILTLDRNGRAYFSTRKLSLGAWYSQIKWNDTLAQSGNYYLRPAATDRSRATKQAATAARKKAAPVRGGSTPTVAAVRAAARPSGLRLSLDPSTGRAEGR